MPKRRCGCVIGVLLAGPAAEDLGWGFSTVFRQSEAILPRFLLLRLPP